VFDQEGRRLLSGSADKTARLWNVAEAQALAVLRGHEASVFGVFHPDGSKVLTAGNQERTARLWDVVTGTELAALPHDAGVLSAHFSPDGHWLVTTSNNSTARLWSVEPPLSEARRRQPRELTLAEMDRFQIGPREARDRVRAIFETILLENDRIARIEAEPELDATLRAAAMHEARPDPEELSRRAHEIVTSTTAGHEEYQRAKRLATAACQLEATEPAFALTLALANLRCGEHEATLEALETAEDLYPPDAPISTRALNKLAAAICHHHLQQPDDASLQLKLAKMLLEKADPEQAAEALTMLREARELIER
jgi:hypothetical protein